MTTERIIRVYSYHRRARVLIGHGLGLYHYQIVESNRKRREHHRGSRDPAHIRRHQPVQPDQWPDGSWPRFRPDERPDVIDRLLLG